LEGLLLTNQFLCMCLKDCFSLLQARSFDGEAGGLFTHPLSRRPVSGTWRTFLNEIPAVPDSKWLN